MNVLDGHIWFSLDWDTVLRRLVFTLWRQRKLRSAVVLAAGTTIGRRSKHFMSPNSDFTSGDFCLKNWQMTSCYWSAFDHFQQVTVTSMSFGYKNWRPAIEVPDDFCQSHRKFYKCLWVIHWIIRRSKQTVEDSNKLSRWVDQICRKRAGLHNPQKRRNELENNP